MSGASAYKVRINTHTSDSSAIILLADGVLIGVLSELSDKCHDNDQGRWTIEIAFGLNEQKVPSTFASASEAAHWLGTRIAGASFHFDGEAPQLR